MGELESRDPSRHPGFGQGGGRVRVSDLGPILFVFYSHLHMGVLVRLVLRFRTVCGFGAAP
jgi:hypothetical protein